MGVINKKQTGNRGYLMKNDSLKGQYRINEQIRAKEVRIVGDEVEPNVYPIAQALKLAEEREVDLVEISPNAQPPVCRIVDYSKFLYQLKKRQKEQKAKQVKVNVKEIRFGPQTDDHDYNFKLKHARGFLEDGDKVKAYVFFKGRSILFKEQGEVLLLRFANDLEDYAPIPEPSISLFLTFSLLKNLSNKCGISSFLIPRPLSSIFTIIFSPFSFKDTFI